MPIRDYPVPSSLRAKRVRDAKDRPLSGSDGQPHVMSPQLVAYGYDRALLYEGDATRPGAHLDKLKAHIYGVAVPNVSGPEFNGVLFINWEGDKWHEVDGKGDNCWNAVTSGSNLRGLGESAQEIMSQGAHRMVRQAKRRDLQQELGLPEAVRAATGTPPRGVGHPVAQLVRVA